MQGYRKGDACRAVHGMRPEFVGIWLGLAKVGAVTAIIIQSPPGDVSSLHHVVRSQSSHLQRRAHRRFALVLGHS